MGACGVMMYGSHEMAGTAAFMTWGSVADWLNVVIVAVLAGLTFWYARTTAAIAHEATRQAEAAHRSVDIMAAQWRHTRLARLLPIQLALAYVLRVISANRPQIDSPNASIHFSGGGLLTEDLVRAASAAKEFSAELHAELSSIENSLRAVTHVSDAASRRRALEALASAETHASKALRIIESLMNE